MFQFHPGGLGIAFLRQFQQAGLLGQIPMVVSFASMDPVIHNAVGEAAIGVIATAHWNSDFDNPASKKFVAEFMKKHNRVPTPYASQAYDTALAIASTLKATNGRVDDANAFRTAMLKADFQSVRGNFKFARNQHPIQDWWMIKVERGADGKPVMKTATKVLSDHADAYGKDCKL